VDHVDHTGGQQVADEAHQIEDRRGGLLGRFEHDGVARGQCKRELPGGHQDREVPRDDLADHTERLMEVIRDGVVIDLGQRTLLRPDSPGKIAEMIDGQRQVGGQRLPDGLAVVPRLGQGQRLQVLFDAVGDLVEDVGAFGGGRLAPLRRGGVGRIESLVDVGVVRAGHFAERLSGHGCRILEVLTAHRRDPFTADEVFVAGFVRHQRVRRTGAAVKGHQELPWLPWANRCNAAHTTPRVRRVPVADDPYLWLEDITGDDALDWVRKHNEPTLTEFGGDRFEQMRAEALEVLDTDARIPYVRRRGDYLYNFWRDAANPRGLWRRTKLQSYRTAEPEWAVFMDVDDLACRDDTNWVWASAEVIEPDHLL